MTVLAWLQSRTPAPPAELMARVVEALGERATADASRASSACLDAAAALLSRLLEPEAIGRDRAIELLAADALVTYAFESAAVDVEGVDERAEVAMLRLADLAAPRGQRTG
ncbi:MAG TPA: hypothetical protein VH539_04985 [Gemmatimonadaceae bacterium]|jgi:hypothetical protein